MFLLGLACGVALLTMSAFRRVSPNWLKGLLAATGLCMMGRYAALALLTAPGDPRGFSPLLRMLWLSNSFGLTLPGVMALDQLLRHPAMSPKKLLARFSPFLAVYGVLLFFAPAKIAPDRTVGWTMHLIRPWGAVLLLTQTAFIAGFIGIGVGLMRKVPSAAIRRALLGLIAGYAYFGFDGIAVALGKWYFRPFLFSEMLILLALWHAYETSAQLQN